MPITEDNIITLPDKVRKPGITSLSIKKRRIKSRRSALSITRYHNKLYDTALEFTRHIMSYPLLKKAWIKAEGDENKAFRELFKHNLYYFLEKEGFSDENIITPNGKDLYFYLAFIDDNLLMLTFSSDEPEDPIFPATLYAFICFNRIEGCVYSFTEFVKAPEFGDGGYCTAIKVPEYLYKALEREPHPYVCIALTSTTQTDDKVFWTYTGTGRFNDPDRIYTDDKDEEDEEFEDDEEEESNCTLL